MSIEIKLPTLFLSDVADLRIASDGSFFLEASNLQELYNAFMATYPILGKKIWNEKGMIRKDIIIIVNDNLINKDDYERLAFPKKTLLEVMTQFAGG